MRNCRVCPERRILARRQIFRITAIVDLIPCVPLACARRFHPPPDGRPVAADRAKIHSAKETHMKSALIAVVALMVVASYSALARPDDNEKKGPVTGVLIDQMCGA